MLKCKVLWDTVGNGGGKRKPGDPGDRRAEELALQSEVPQQGIPRNSQAGQRISGQQAET